MSLPRLLVAPLSRLLAGKSLRADRFGTLAAIAGVALGAATVDCVVILDANTTRIEAARAASAEAPRRETIDISPVHRGEAPTAQAPTATKPAPKPAASEDHDVLRAGIRGGSLAAFLVGALIVFFTFAAVIDRRRREVGLLRSLGALPAQVAAIFVREAAVVGLAGGALGFAASIPMALLAARAGVTTTGHLKISPEAMTFPWGAMLLTSLVGASMALLGLVRPLRAALRLELTRALRPGFLGDEGAAPSARRPWTAILLPAAVAAAFAARPLARAALPPVAFHALEAVTVTAAFLAALVLVPALVRRSGGLLMRLLPGGRGAARLLVQRRVEHLGHELAWSVSGVMLVFSLLLTLHLVTHALRREVVTWAAEALHDETFVLPWYPNLRADTLTAALPPGERIVLLTGRTPWPNALHAGKAEELAALAAAHGRPDHAAIARRLGPGKIVLSTLMAKRYRVREGDWLDVSGKAGSRRLEIVGVTDGLGFTPMNAPHRNARTYGLLDVADADLIAPYAGSLGTVAIVAGSDRPAVERWRGAPAAALQNKRGIYLMPALFYRNLRLSEAQSDFVVFDLLLGFTSTLAGLGIANQLVLSVRARRREIALYRVLGMTAGDVLRLVLLEGALIGLLGGALAAVLGVPLGYVAVGGLRAISGFEAPFAVPLAYPLLTILGAVVVSTLASLLPAVRAARADSAEGVHHE